MHFMKKVNRKFLEEQVKISLKEIGMQDVGAGSALSKDDNIDPERILDAAKTVGPMLKAFFLGSDESYEAVGTYLKDLGLYGVGDTKYITKVLDTIPKLTQGPNAGINQTALRFMKVDPFTGDWNSKILFNPEIVKYFINLRDRWAPNLEKTKKTKNKGSLRRSLEGMLKGDGGLEDAASKFNFDNSSSIVKIFQDESSPTVASSKEIWQPVSDANLDRYVDYIMKSKDTKKATELILMSQFPYLRNMTFKQAYQKMATQSDLDLLVSGIVSFEYFKKNSSKALMGAGEIFLSLGTTVAAVVTGGASLLGKGAQAAATAPIKKGIARKAGESMLRATKSLGSFKAQFLPLVITASKGSYEHFTRAEDQLKDIGEKLDSYFTTYKDKSEKERVQFFDKEILPLVKDIQNNTALAVGEYFKAVGTDYEDSIKLIKNDKSFENTLKSHVVNFRAKESRELIGSALANILRRTKETAEMVKGLGKSQEKLAGAEEELKKDKDALQKIEKTKISISVPNFSAEEATVVDSEPEVSQIEDGPVEILVFGDSIGVGIQQQLGVSGKTKGGIRTDQILKNMESYFSSQIKENKESKKTIIISGGINDLASGISPDKVINNLDKMINLAKSKGYNVRVVPLLGLKGDKQDEIDQINNSLANRQDITLIDKSDVELSKDGVHPKSYKNLSSNAASGIPYVKSKKAPTNKVSSKKSVQKVKVSPRAEKYWPLVKSISSTEGLNPYLVMGIIFAESGFNPKAVSHKGAQGLMQLMPRTAAEFGVEDPFDPEQNIKGGIKAFKAIRNAYVPRIVEKSGTKINWNDLTEQQKDRLGLYSYNFGPKGLMVNNFKIEKSSTIEDYFARVNSWYLKKHGYDYADKIFNYANAYGGNYTSLSAQPSQSVDLGTGAQSISGAAAAQEKPTAEPEAAAAPPEPPKTDTASIGQQIKAVENSKNFGEFDRAYSALIGQTFGSSLRGLSDMIQAHNRLKNKDISKFIKQKTDYLKAIHAQYRSTWKAEYEKDLKDPAKKEDADKKVAWFHRPIFFGKIRASGARKFFATSPSISIAFEPNNSSVSVSYSGNKVFYKQDRQDNKNYSRFLQELGLLKKSVAAINSKMNQLLQAGDDRSESIRELSKYTTRLGDVVDAAYDGLQDTGNSAGRKAFLVSILDQALRTI